MGLDGFGVTVCLFRMKVRCKEESDLNSGEWRDVWENDADMFRSVVMSSLSNSRLFQSSCQLGGFPK